MGLQNGANRGQPGSYCLRQAGQGELVVMRSAGQAHGELTIGIIGPHELVERIMLDGFSSSGQGGTSATSAMTAHNPARRLVAAAYRDEQEAADKAARLGSAVDACLFASHAAYEHARRAGVLRVPAAYIPLSGSALYAALLRASRNGHGDLGRSSVDVLSRADVDEAFAELGIPARGVHVREDFAGPAALASFHERLWRQDETSVAFTCLQSVAQRLSAARIPVFTLRPTGSAIRSALRTAALLGGNRRLEDAQLTVIIVEVPTLRDTTRRAVPRYSREELRLTVHRFLVQEAQRIQAAVSPVSDHGFLITATRGSLAGVTEGFRVPPFAERASSELGIGIEVGVGTGRTALDAEARARSMLGRARPGSAAPSAAVDTAGRTGPPTSRAAAAAATGTRGLETLARLASKLPAADAPLVVDAETTGRLLAVTPRTARRLLHSLVAEGLAWPLPPSRTPQPGRPRQSYRLVVEKLDRGPAR
jgi:hypothetical protein